MAYQYICQAERDIDDALEQAEAERELQSRLVLEVDRCLYQLQWERGGNRPTVSLHYEGECIAEGMDIEDCKGLIAQLQEAVRVMATMQ